MKNFLLEDVKKIPLSHKISEQYNEQEVLVVQYNEVIRAISNLFIIFYEKVLSIKKHSQAKIK